MIIWRELFGISELLNVSEFPTSCRQIVDMLQYGGDDSPLFYMRAMWIKYEYNAHIQLIYRGGSIIISSKKGGG